MVFIYKQSVGPIES